jgi:putative ABC transport system substrate-binding protein
MRRRELISLLSGAACAWPLAASAQQPGGMRRVGVLMNSAANELEPQARLAAFVQGLRQSGWTEGQNVHIDIRWNAADTALSGIYTAQLIGLMPDVILVASTANLTAVTQATRTVPLVFVQISDPVEQGFVSSLTRPGGNVTGFGSYEFSVGGKWLGLLKEITPTLMRIGFMFNPDTAPQSKFFMPSLESAAATLGVHAMAIHVRSTAEIEPAIEMFARQPNGALILPTDAFLRLHSKLIADAALRQRLPLICTYIEIAKDGGLMCYSVSNNSLESHYRQAAGYVDRILKGAKTADLPVQMPTKYDFVINLKTAKALGLSVPLPLLGLADEVIE